MRKRAWLGWLLPALFAFGCGPTEPTEHPSESQALLTEARRLWQSHRLTDYTYVFSRGCFCPFEFREPATITVRAGAVVSAVSVQSGEPRNLAWYQTIDGLFDTLQKAIDGGAPLVDAEYDPVLGYPTSVYIDLDERLADEEISYEAKALTPIH